MVLANAAMLPQMEIKLSRVMRHFLYRAQTKVNTHCVALDDTPCVMESHERLKMARERAGFETAADAARRFGWSESTYRAAENGARPPSKRKVVDYARAFRVSPEWILFGTGGPEKKSVPLIGYIGSGAEVFIMDEGIDSFDDVTPPPGISPNAVAIIVRGDSMWPRYSEGDVIIYDENTSPEHANGRECVVALQDGRRYVKNIRKNSDGSHDLESWNAPPIRNVEIEWVAEIVWVKRA